MAEHKRLVYAAEVKEIFDYEVAQGETDLFDAFDTAIENATTVDAAEVVRCKDCEHYSNNGYQKCRLHSTEPDQYGPGADVCMEPDDFCSYGERRASNAQTSQT